MSDRTRVEGDIDVVRMGQATAEIVVSSRSGEVIRNAALTLQREIRRRTGVELPIRTGVQARVKKAAIYLGTAERDVSVKEVLAALGRGPVSAQEPGAEGFLLVSGRQDSAGVVVINGCDDLGTFHGVGWLLRKMRFSEGEAVVPIGLEVSTAPATWQRRIRFGDHFGYVNAELEGWEDIWSDYILWGLSAVTMRCDPAHQGDPRETGLAEYLWNKWTDRVPLAKSLGLEVVHLTQTNLVAKDGEFGPAQIPDFEELNYMCFDFNGVNPKFARGREVLRQSRKWFFDNMPYVEQVSYITSGWDGGGCYDPEVAPWVCTYADLVDQIIYPLLEEHNPQAQVILSIYACPDSYALAGKVQHGWRPKWLSVLEFDNPDIAPLFPEGIKRVYYPMWTTDFHTRGWYQTVGANPCPRLCEAVFEHVYYDCGIRDGLGCYSEGTHDFVNQIIMMQLAWDPEQPVDAIVDELCRYYFGERAAPLVKEAFYLMEMEKPDTAVDDLVDPRMNPRVQELVQEAERLMPEWARRSRQWAMVTGRAGIVRTRRCQADLIPEFDEHWGRYRALVEAGSTKERPDWVDETCQYLRSVVESGQEMVAVYKRMQREGFGVIGGGQMALYPNPLTGGAIEGLAALETWRDGSDFVAPGRWCVAYLNQQGRVAVSDGWSNQIILQEGPTAADAQLVFADVYGDGSARIVYLGSDGCLYSWSPVQDVKLLAEGEFLTGPLAAGDVDGDGSDEVVVLSGRSAEEGCLAVVDGSGKVRLLGVRPGGLAAEVAAKGVFLEETRPEKAVQTGIEPRVQVCDVDGDGRMEIICADRDAGNRLVVLDGMGKRKAIGPEAPAGAVAAGDLDGDGVAEVVFLDREHHLAAYSFKEGVVGFGESVQPQWTSAVAVAHVDGEALPGVIFADEGGMLRVMHVGGRSRLLTDFPSSVAVGPGMAVGDYDGDGREEVCYLRRRLAFLYPLSTLSIMDGSGGLRDIPLGYWYLSELRRSYGAPLGPRASGRMRFPTIEFDWDREAGFIDYV